MDRLVLWKVLTLSAGLAFNGDTPPTEFRLFKAGTNETTKGEFIFDAKAAEMVMAAAKSYGNDYAIDLEHLSIDNEAKNYDPDARGWFSLEVRNGELWAVNVRWTPDGLRRLSERTQRYISPAFFNDEDRRVAEIMNVALVATPATHGTPALVAANRRHTPMTLKERIALLSARVSRCKSKIATLADTAGAGGDAPAGKFAAVKAAADAAAQALADFDKASGGSDVDATFAAMEAAVKAVDAFETAVTAISGGSGSEPEAPAPAPAAASQQDQQQMARDKAELIALKAEKARREEEEKVQKLAAEMTERSELEAKLVKAGRETPATVKLLASLSLADLRERVRMFEGSPSPSVLNRIAPPSGHFEQPTTGALSEEEATYIKARHGELTRQGQKLHKVDDTLVRFQAKKLQQIRGAEEKGDRGLAKELSAPITGANLLFAARAGLVTLASTPVTPFQELGPSSQIALQQFRLDYNLALASIIGGWAEIIGRVLSDGAVKTTYPINFRALRYTEKTSGGPAAGQPMNADVEVVQREFQEGQEIELRRLIKGDFAYVQSWAQLAADLARARIFLRDELATAQIEANALWGVTSLNSAGIDTKAFFATDHAVNPFDATRKLRGSATYSNKQGTAAPFGSTALTAEKNSALQVAAPDGRELGVTFDGILYPSILEQAVYNLLKVQDLLLDAKTTLNGVSNVMGQVRNPHFNSGLEMTRAQQLAGTDATTCDWYLYSREAIARGLVPWVIAEDPTEEVRLFDENSDFYKRTGLIRYESHVFLNVALLYPHAVRLIKGS